jgi:hypothetical protein
MSTIHDMLAGKAQVEAMDIARRLRSMRGKMVEQLKKTGVDPHSEQDQEELKNCAALTAAARAVEVMYVKQEMRVVDEGARETFPLKGELL